MSIAEAAHVPTSVAPPAAGREVGAPRRTPPVVYWAAVGGAVIALQAYLYIAWVTSDEFKQVPSGVTPVPGWMKTVALSWQLVACLGALAFVYWFVVRPWRREGRLNTDSFLCMGFLLMYWQDPYINYSGVWFTYNSYMVNMGSWGPKFPGWLAPHSPGHVVPEPLGWVPAAYVFLLFGATVLMSRLMGRARERWPRLHPLGLMAICFALVVVLDVAVEGFFWMPLGFYTYAGGHGITFPSRYYKFPIEEALLLGAAWVGWASLRLFKDDKGHTLVERGIDSLGISPRRKSAVRFLAIVGAVNVVYIVVFMIPAQWVGMHPSSWSRDIQKRSYLMDGVCGQGTTYACPGPSIPNVHGNRALHVGPNGALVLPPGVRPPRAVPLQRS